MTFLSRPGPRLLAGIAASALLCALYARGGPWFPLGFVALVPWLLALDGARGPAAALRDGWLMSLAFVLTVLGWFGTAIGAYVGIGALPGLLVALLAAPLLQPQFLAFVLVRQWVGRRHGAALRALAGACAWVATEWLWPKLLGDTLGHGLHPSALLRQSADLAGAAGLSFVLLLCNEAVAAALRGRRDGRRAWMPPLGVALALPLLLAGYGALRLSALQAADAQAATLRVGMVQTAIVDYERLRREMGAYAVVRTVLDTHFAMSREALERAAGQGETAAGGADALLWSETVYPTTFGQPKSEAGGEFDREILDFAESAGVPLVFGTYDRDAEGEYNAAAFVDPQRGLLGFYRKSRPFPLTEYVPPWLDGPALRRALPWAGTWRPGHGARVMPLFLADGREVPVLPLICLDDTDPQLAIDGARQGAQAILGMSNDAWFSDHPIGAELHLAVARFRSIETRLPQLRVTANGISSAIDAGGEVIARAPMGEPALLVGEVRIGEPMPTLMRAWGDWLGGACLFALIVFALASALRRARLGRRAESVEPDADPATYRARATLLGPAARIAATALGATAGLALLWLGAALMAGDARVGNALSLLRLFAALVLAPTVARWALMRAFAAELRIVDGQLRIAQRGRTIDIRLEVIDGLRLWRLPCPHSGLRLRLKGQTWSPGLALEDPARLAEALQRAGAPLAVPPDAAAAFARARAGLRRPWPDAPWFKFALFALVPALPAFRLHQIIAYGGPFGEYHTFGLQAYLAALLLWWGQWVVHLAMFAAWLRLLVEAAAWAGAHWRPGLALPLRRRLEFACRLAYFAGVPLWLAWRLLG